MTFTPAPLSLPSLSFSAVACHRQLSPIPISISYFHISPKFLPSLRQLFEMTLEEISRLPAVWTQIYDLCRKLDIRFHGRVEVARVDFNN